MTDTSPEQDRPQDTGTDSAARAAGARPGSGSAPKRPIRIGSQREEQPSTSPAPHRVEIASADSEPAAPTAHATFPANSSDSDDKAVSAPLDSPPADEMDIQPVAFPKPRLGRITSDLQKEIDEALSGVSIDDLLTGKAGPTKGTEPQPDERYDATVVKLHGDDVFFSLPGNYEGIAALKQFTEAPQLGAQLPVIVRRFNPEDGLYELSVPGQSVSVSDWGDLEEGAIVEARVTGHNSGGLECEVNGIPGFIPISQVSQYRVEDLEQFLNEKFACVVTEANPDRRNLVLSRRAVLEREEAENREKLLASLAVGQEHEGLVRNIRDFGAFVDLGGIDGLVHISKLSWDRVRHPSDVLQEGQRIKVKIESIDEVTGKIGLSYRDTIPHPWTDAVKRFSPQMVVQGTVSKIMDFGAFVRLEAGVEGLVHISELAHHRVSRVNTVVREGDQVEVKILSVDPENQRMSLSIKAVQAAPVTKSDKAAEQEEEPLREKVTKATGAPLKGGTNRRSGGDQFGLTW